MSEQTELKQSRKELAIAANMLHPCFKCVGELKPHDKQTTWLWFVEPVSAYGFSDLSCAVLCVNCGQMAKGKYGSVWSKTFADAVENWNAANPAPEPTPEPDLLSQLEAENKSLRAEKEEYAENLRLICKVIEENPLLKMAFDVSANTMKTEENKPA